jgi:hypothetical protein
VGIGISGCKKETTNTPVAVSAADQKITRQVQTFKQKLISNLKDGEDVKLDSAIWYLEATLNFTYARANNTRDVINLDSAKIVLPLIQKSTILSSDLATAYANLVDSLSLHYHAIPGEKGVVFTDLAIIESADNNVVIKMTDMITTTSNSGHSGFGPDDYWLWGNNGRKCDGTLMPWDAAKKLAQHANMGDCVLPISCYTSVEQSPMIFPEDVPSSGNPFGYWDYLLFELGGLNPEVSQCLSPDAMNYYLAGLKTIANLYKPVGKQTIKYYCISDLLVPTDFWLHLHRAQITYGVPIAVSDPPGDL